MTFTFSNTMTWMMWQKSIWVKAFLPLFMPQALHQEARKKESLYFPSFHGKGALYFHIASHLGGQCQKLWRFFIPIWGPSWGSKSPNQTCRVVLKRGHPFGLQDKAAEHNKEHITYFFVVNGLPFYGEDRIWEDRGGSTVFPRGRATTFMKPGSVGESGITARCASKWKTQWQDEGRPPL